MRLHQIEEVLDKARVDYEQVVHDMGELKGFMSRLPEGLATSLDVVMKRYAGGVSTFEVDGESSIGSPVQNLVALLDACPPDVPICFVVDGSTHSVPMNILVGVSYFSDPVGFTFTFGWASKGDTISYEMLSVHFPDLLDVVEFYRSGDFVWHTAVPKGARFSKFTDFSCRVMDACQINAFVDKLRALAAGGSL